MKKFLIGFAIFVLLIGAGIYTLMSYLSADKIQKQLIEKVKEQTGRDIAFDAMQPAFFFPNIGMRVRNVTFSNAPWAHDKNMLELEELDLHLALKPLLSHRVEIARLTLKKPVIHLETTADGKSNWDIAKRDALKEKSAPKADEDKSASSGAASGFMFKFGQMSITGGGTLTFRDGKKGTVATFDGVNASVTYPDFESAFQMDGEFNFRNKRVNVLLNLTKPLDFFRGKPSEGDFTIKGPDCHAKLFGNLATTGTLFTGSVDAQISSLSDFAGWLEGGKTKLPFEDTSLTANVSATATSAKLTGVKLKLDDLAAGGDVTAAFAGRPNVKANLSINHIDLDKFTEASKETAAAKGTSAAKSGAAAPDWDATPMDFGGLKTFDADITLQTKGFTVKGAEAGPSTLTAELNGGVLHAKSSDAEMFSGKFSSDLTLNSATPSIALKFKMSDVQAKPMLTAFAGFKKLDGKAFLTADLTSTGNSQKALIGNLSGKGTFDFKNGSVEGINLVKFAELIQSRLESMNIGEGKTEFVDMGGTFTAANGNLHNEDLKMKGPLVQATGSGDVDIAKKFVKYRVLPVLTASSAVENAKGLTIPVDITGPFSAVKAKPDYKAVIKDIFDKPENTKAVIKNVREQGKDILKDLKSDPNKALNRLLGIPSPEPAPAPAPDAQQPDGATAPPPPDQQPQQAPATP